MDTYYTVEGPGEGRYTEKMSRFLAFARPAASAAEAREIVKELQNRYHDARHVCWAYMIGPQRNEWQLNDNGEPSGTAGKPILGQINSLELTDVVVAVVRYFGGIKLGTSGLIVAYREAARLALEAAGRKECHEMRSVKAIFPYVAADGVMKISKLPGIEVTEREFDNVCSVTLRMRADMVDEMSGRLDALSGVSVEII
ncbi:MAG: YigZ family protein [Muribaculaceae bacterium]|nr:YigZ family protein [Muribaculaceae bacterium]